MTMDAEIRYFFRSAWEMLTPDSWRFNCVTCKYTGWISGESWAGYRGYRYTDHCPECFPTPRDDQED